MAVSPSADQMVGILRETVVALVRRDGPDLSARQLGVFLTCYLRDGGHTVRGLAAELNVSKPAITRALDRLGELDLARRKVDPLDRRSILVQRTLKGAAFLRDLRSIMGEAPPRRRRRRSRQPARPRAGAPRRPDEFNRGTARRAGIIPSARRPRRWARRATKPSQHICGGSVSSGTNGLAGVGAARNNSAQMPPKPANPQCTSVTAAAGTPERCAT